MIDETELMPDMVDMYHFIQDQLQFRENTCFVFNVDDTLTEDEWGYCLYIDIHLFEIDINPHLTYEQRFRGLAHELVHAKQYQDGILVYDETNKVNVWLGGPVMNVLPIVETREWEIDAMNREEALWREWRLHGKK